MILNLKHIYLRRDHKVIHSMEVLQHLGPNKVTQVITSNMFEETHIKHACPPFDSIFDPASHLKPRSKPVVESLYQPERTALGKIDSLYYIFARRLDSTIDLFQDVDLQNKIRQFRDGVIKAFEIRVKELGLTKSKITKESLQQDARHVLIYMSKLLDINIFWDNSLFKGVNESDNVLVITHTQTEDRNSFEQGNDITLKECYKRLGEGIESKLVKEVREVAGMLDINLYDSDKKLRPKKALIDLISEKVA